MQVATFTKSGTKAPTAAKLSKTVYGIEKPNHQLIKDAYVAYQANGRENLAKTLRRGEVRGGGKKPWKQKGTGRARFGSIRVPIWRGGGITFGPLGVENYTKKVNAKAGKAALRHALTLAAKEDSLRIIETFECKDGKVKPTLNLLSKIGAKGNILIVVSLKDELVERATRNLPKVKAVQANYLNVFDVVNADTIVMSKKAVEIIDKRLGGKDE